MIDTLIVTPQPSQVLIVQGSSDVLQIPQTSVDDLSVGISGSPGAPGVNGDKTFTEAFSDSSDLTVQHNLAKYPAVSVMDTAGDEVEGDVQYIDNNSLTIQFSSPFSGTVTCN